MDTCGVKFIIFDARVPVAQLEATAVPAYPSTASSGQRDFCSEALLLVAIRLSIGFRIFMRFRA